MPLICTECLYFCGERIFSVLPKNECRYGKIKMMARRLHRNDRASIWPALAGKYSWQEGST